MGLTGAAYAIDAAPPGQSENSQSSQALASDIAAQIEYWPAHCTELEQAKRNTEASRCWWYAAEELNRYPLTDEVKELRRDWLWRGVRLSRQLLEPPRSAAVEPVSPPEIDPALLAAQESCASDSSGSPAECSAASPAVAAPPDKLTPPRKKAAAIPKIRKKKEAKAQVARARTTPVAATPVVAAPPGKLIRKQAAATPKVRKKKVVQAEVAQEKPTLVRRALDRILGPAEVRAAQAAVPILPERTTNIACPPTKPCIGRRLPTGSPR